MHALYRDRADAGRALARALEHHAGRDGLLILALPRGGVPVAYEVARRLDAPLDVLVVRKLGVPRQEELAMGAIASGGAVVLNRDIVDELGLTREDIETVLTAERAELVRRERVFRGDRPPLNVEGRVVILIDDGLATGATMRAAVEALRSRRPAGIVVAVPVAPPEAVEKMAEVADEVVALATPAMFMGVGRWYEDFTQTTDEQVRDLLQRARDHAGSNSTA